MNFVNLILKDYRRFRTDINKAWLARKKAAEISAKVEGFRLKEILQKEIEAGAPGGRQFDPLSEIARRMRRPMNRTPLRRLAKIVRIAYGKDGGKYTVKLGFVDPYKGTSSLSKSWKRIAERQQAGFTHRITGVRRRAILLTAYGMGKRARGRKYLFLKKATQDFKTPARPIIDPFWAAHKAEADRNIQRNFARKLAGERI